MIFPYRTPCQTLLRRACQQRSAITAQSWARFWDACPPSREKPSQNMFPHDDEPGHRSLLHCRVSRSKQPGLCHGEDSGTRTHGPRVGARAALVHSPARSSGSNTTDTGCSLTLRSHKSKGNSSGCCPRLHTACVIKHAHYQ